MSDILGHLHTPCSELGSDDRITQKREQSRLQQEDLGVNGVCSYKRGNGSMGA